jgi:hypothetical protein
METGGAGGSGVGVGAGVLGSTVTVTAGGAGGVSAGGIEHPAREDNTTTTALSFRRRRGIGLL